MLVSTGHQLKHAGISAYCVDELIEQRGGSVT